MSEGTTERPPRWTPDRPHPEPAPLHLRPKPGENCRVCGRTYETCVGGDTIEESFEKRIALNDLVDRTVAERIDLALYERAHNGGNQSTSESERLAEEARKVYHDNMGFTEGNTAATKHIVNSILRASSFLTLRDSARKLCELFLGGASQTEIERQVNVLTSAIKNNEKDLEPLGAAPRAFPSDLPQSAKELAGHLSGSDNIVSIGCGSDCIIIYTKKATRALANKYKTGYNGFRVDVKRIGGVKPL